jgi:hypothetical protein
VERIPEAKRTLNQGGKKLLDKLASLRIEPDPLAESIRISINKEVIKKKSTSGP